MASFNIWCTIERVNAGVHVALIVVAPSDGSIEESGTTPEHDLSFHGTHTSAVDWCARQTERLTGRVIDRGDSVVKREMVG